MKKHILAFLGRTLERMLLLSMVAVTVDYSCFTAKRAAAEISESVSECLMPLLAATWSQPKETDDDRAKRKVRDLLKGGGLRFPPSKEFR